MVKYQTEGDIDFYQELFHSLSDNETNLEKCTNIDNDNYDNLCLITNNTLTENFVKLDCGHSFNYLPLYKDIVNHKNKFNSMEIKDSILKIGQIRCPYCRTIHNKLIPYIEIEGVEKKHGINFFDENHEKYLHKFIGQCCYTSVNPYFDDKKEENPVLNSKIIVCDSNEVIKIKEDGKDYCYYHKYLVQKQIIKDAVKLKKQQLKEAKILAKIEEKKQKMMEKELLKIAKTKAKKVSNSSLLNLNLNLEENVVLGENVVVNVFCSAILKSGKNIGCHCTNKAIENGRCKRHVNTSSCDMENKVIESYF